jgi:Txe/YoeB family toxin of Txe-Axe toxin-antitoxin module
MNTKKIEYLINIFFKNPYKTKKPPPPLNNKYQFRFSINLKQLNNQLADAAK